jgi:probable phosphomutase (TIGR03848 family)
MTLLLLVRHGHTDAAGKRLTGWAPGIHLNAHGREEADALLTRLEEIPVDAIYSSPLERCRETAAPLAHARRLSVRIRRGLIETGYGDWTGRTISQLRRTTLWKTVERTPSAVRFPGGESLLEVQARAVDEMNQIAAGHPNGTVVVVSHSDPIRLFIAHVAGAHVDHLHRLVVDTASVTAVSMDHGTPRLLKVNDTGGLSGLAGRGPRPRTRTRTAKVRG